MTDRSRIFRTIGKILYGVVSGFFWYLLFVYIIPYFLYTTGFPYEEVPEFYLLIFAFFMTIETAGSLVENIVYKFLLNSLTKLLGLWLLVRLLNNGIISTSLSSQGALTSITMNFTPILYLIAIWTFATILLDFVGILPKGYS